MRPFGPTISALLFASALLSCGAAPLEAVTPAWALALPENLPLEGELVVRPEATEEPSIELRFPWRNPDAVLGWGAAHLWARPGRDHVSVSAIVDAPSQHERWGECHEIVIMVDGERLPVRAEKVGRPMNAGQMYYEAVQLQLGIQHLRALADGRDARASICGDEMVLSEEQQTSMAHFVQWFDHLAAPRYLGDAPYFRDVGPEPEMPIEEEVDLEPLEG